MYRFISCSIIALCLTLFLGNSPAFSQEKGEMMDGEMMDTKEISADKININTADMEQLMQLPGVGKGTAKKIIDYRNSNGQFKTLEEIKSIQGIGDKKFEKMKDMITM